MSVRTVAGKFMELCSQGKHFEFMRSFYAPEIVSVEGDGKQQHLPQPGPPRALLLWRRQREHRPVRRLHRDRVLPQGRRRARQAR